MSRSGITSRDVGRRSLWQGRQQRDKHTKPTLAPRRTQLVHKGGGDGGISSQFAIGDVLHKRIAASKHETRASRRMANRDALFIDLSLTALPELLSAVMARSGQVMPEQYVDSRRGNTSAKTKLAHRSIMQLQQIENQNNVNALVSELDVWIDEIVEFREQQELAKRSDAPVRVVDEQYWSSFWETYRADTTKADEQRKKKSPRSKGGTSRSVKLPTIGPGSTSGLTPRSETKSLGRRSDGFQAMRLPQKKLAETVEQKCERILSEFVPLAVLAESPCSSSSPSQRTARPFNSTFHMGFNQGVELDRTTLSPSESFASQSPQYTTSQSIRPYGGLESPRSNIKNLLGYRFKGFDDYKKNAPANEPGQLPPLQMMTARESKARSPNATSFHRPWSSDIRNEPVSGTRLVKNSEDIHMTPVRRFAMICRSVGVNPKPQSMWFLIQGAEFGELALRDAGYADEDLLAITAALHYTEEVEVVDVGDNNRLTDASVGPLLKLLANAHSSTLRELYLDRCRRVGNKSIRLIHNLLSKSFHCIEKLNLSGIPIAFHEYAELTKVINRHENIREVYLAETGLGLYDRAQAAACIGRLLANPRLEVLDLSWNFLDALSLDAVGNGLHNHRRLSSLSLANTGPTVDPTLDGSPVLAFLEHLAFDESLTTLDISNNALNADAALVLESAAPKHPVLREVLISSNPIGLLGIRSLLRLVASQESGLQTVQMDDCTKGGRHSSKGAAMDGDPSGKYVWTMEFPLHRALVRLLLIKWTDGESAIPIDKLFRQCTFDGKSIQCSSIIRKIDGIWDCPMKGELAMEVCIGDMLFSVPEPSASTFLDRTLRQTKVPLNIMSRSLAVLGLGHERHTEDERNLFLTALSLDFVLGPEHIDALCYSNSTKNKYNPSKALSQLLPCLRGNAQMRQAITLTRSLDDLMLVHKEAESLLHLNIENPTGFYALHLGTPCQGTVARHLLLVNRWEASAWVAKCGQRDVSENGNFKCLRNVRYANRPWQYESDDWRLPGDGLFEFDFVSLRRPPANALPMPDEQWATYLSHIKHTMSGLFHGDAEESSEAIHDKLSDEDVLTCIRATSSVLWIKCRQLRELLCFLQDPSTRQEVFICLFFRTTDAVLNEKLIRSKFSHEDWNGLKQRMGHITLFPFFQPENSKFELNLSVYEQRRCAYLLKTLESNEPGDTMKNPLMMKEGKEEWEKFLSGVPFSWQQFEGIPSSGAFKTSYVCSADNVRLRTRRKLACDWGGWALPEDNKAILRDLEWWALLDEQPPEVNEFIEFLAARFEDLAKPFSLVDTSGDGNVTLSEFLAGMKNLGYVPPSSQPKKSEETSSRNTQKVTVPGVSSASKWKTAGAKITTMSFFSKLNPKKFDKRDSRGMVVLEEATLKRNEAAYKEIFRFLNVDAHGEISLKEWQMMESYMRELKLSMCEFVEYLLMGFGDLETAWDAADADGSGALDLEEFLAIGEKWVVVGPIRPIFFYLDKDNSGEIDRDEWFEMIKLVGKHKVQYQEAEGSDDGDGDKSDGEA